MCHMGKKLAFSLAFTNLTRLNPCPYLYILFLTTQGHGVISSMPVPPPRQLKHERQYTPSTHSVIPTRRICNGDDDGQMILGDLGGLKFPDICLTGEEKPRKNHTQETCPDRGSNPGPLRDKRACYHFLHSGGHFYNEFDKKIINTSTSGPNKLPPAGLFCGPRTPFLLTAPTE